MARRKERAGRDGAKERKKSVENEQEKARAIDR
jgi:hypothetical protein